MNLSTVNLSLQGIVSVASIAMCACDAGPKSEGSAGPGCWSCDTQAQAPEGVGEVAETWSTMLQGRYVGQIPAGGALDSATFELEISTVAGASTMFDRLKVPMGCEPIPNAAEGCAGYTLPLVADMTLSGAPFGQSANRITVFDATAACQPRASDDEPVVNGCPHTQVEYVAEDDGHVMNILIDDTGLVWGSFLDGASDQPTLWGQRTQ